MVRNTTLVHRTADLLLFLDLIIIAIGRAISISVVQFLHCAATCHPLDSYVPQCNNEAHLHPLLVTQDGVIPNALHPSILSYCHTVDLEAPCSSTSQRAHTVSACSVHTTTIWATGVWKQIQIHVNA